MTSSRTFKPNGSSDANFYRLFDIFALFLAFQCSALFYNFELTPIYMVSVLTVALSFLYCAEIFSAYRSWRAGKFRTMV
ncbi:undecaprenyl-phosphate glucose phosphotransferase, partial [Pseudoalteromonas sp. SG45-6]|nr:undecaprenyl-phosphate glucose phosphotransferase [Pseudoalteromonas sp. SG45-6]